MSTLRVPVDEAGAIDIIAIHGLGGHYKNTWKWVSEDGTQEHDWLVEFLPKQIPNARIMTYGYNSAVQFSKSVADIRVFATQLLNDLETKRLTPCQECRPIVFICHSLGGLVFKRATNEQHRFSDTLGHIQGVAFFATPHTGASLANWGAMFGKILKASSVGTSGNTKPLKDLENRGAVVQDITRSAIDRLKMLPTILTFIETETMPYLGFRVVDEDSAVLNLPNEQRFFMNANHLNICKFKDPEGPYEQVSVRLKAMSDA
ncbi:Alpha/Beta hydrolase protein, partial [Calycina marina]